MLKQALPGTAGRNGRARASARKGRITQPRVGRLIGLDAAGIALVDYPGNVGGAVSARTTVALLEQHVGHEVALLFEDGDPQRPLIVGVLQLPCSPRTRTAPLNVTLDGETLTLTAAKEIVLRCGKATIVLAEDGKITLRGTYLQSRSSGVNRIQGGSVELN